MNNVEIKCPCCGWKPDGGAYWSCTCGHVWNTFDTYGVCPSCQKKWKDTQCPEDSCNQWSKHEDWYVVPIDFNKLLELVSHPHSDERIKKSG